VTHSGPEVLFQDLRRDEIGRWWWWCDCGQQQWAILWTRMMWTKFDDGLQLLHKAEDDAVKWLEFTAFAKW